ncbi:MAG: SMC-Scp complex subunit ScpB [Oscillospiraceae bacterium]
MEHEELLSVIEAILFAAGDPVPASRIALVTGEETQTIVSAARELAAAYEENRCGMRLVQMNDLLQLCSAPEYAEYIRRALEQRKPPKLSQPALEVLAIVAYFQPVTRAYIDQVRGVDECLHGHDAARARAHRGLRQARRARPPVAVPHERAVSAHHGYAVAR